MTKINKIKAAKTKLKSENKTLHPFLKFETLSEIRGLIFITRVHVGLYELCFFNFKHNFYDNIVIELDASKNNLKVD